MIPPAKARIPKVKPLPPVLDHVRRAINPIVEIVNKGIGVDSDTVIFKRLPDGRLKAYLHPRIVDQFE